MLPAAALASSVLVLAGCGDFTNHATDGDAVSLDPGSCNPDPLRTNLAPLWNGMSVDIDDCPILDFAAKYHEPDAMIFKAIGHVESRFQYDAVGCTGNSGYCPVRGWTASECARRGAMQTGAWCDSSNLPPGCVATGGGLLANGHVDLQTDPGGANGANSISNPVVNIELGIAGIACNRAQAKAAFPGCSEDQYMIMAVGNFNSCGSTKSCTVYNFDCDSGA